MIGTMILSIAPLLHFEWRRVSRSPMRALATVVFLLCGVYAIGSGVHHVEEWERTLGELEAREREQRDTALEWFRAGKTGPEERKWINITQPRWADRYAAAHAVMTPEPLAALAIGLSDIRSPWAAISAMSGAKSFQSNDPATLGNAEKLMAGNFDLVFVLAYLMPLLLLVLLFDVGTLERDLGMMRLVQTQTRSPTRWWIQRLALPILLVAGLVVTLCVIGGAWSGAITATPGAWMAFSGLALGYTILWGALFSAVLCAGTGTSAAALWMVGLWLGFCVLVPAAVRQYVGQHHPSLYASKLTTTLRSERYAILLSDAKEYEPAFYEARPRLTPPEEPPPHGAAVQMGRMVRQATFIDMASKVTAELGEDEARREAAVAHFGWVNPAYVLQRALCVLAGTESVSYRRHRGQVLESVSARLEELVDAQWHDQPIDQAKFEGLFDHGPRDRYGAAPEQGTFVQLASLILFALAAAGYLTRFSAEERRPREC